MYRLEVQGLRAMLPDARPAEAMAVSSSLPIITSLRIFDS
jgi:hypothetical protein